ncbi:MAG: (2Fe-2S)-binding protein [Verrucomicrobia bacterium]|nr:MAG: (2Fe-2S)-binding protein [Verrucomicrobiota bacterium]
MNHTQNLPPRAERRNFLKKVLAVFFGALAAMVPGVAGLVVFLDPLRRKSQNRGMIRVTSLNALPEDGTPRKFPVIASYTDAWNKMPDVPIGAIYLRRKTDQSVQAFNVICPHLGCFVDYVAKRKGFFCPCHNSSFGLNGKIDDPRSPSPRGLDELAVEIRNGNEIWVRFQNFRTGVHSSIPV